MHIGDFENSFLFMEEIPDNKQKDSVDHRYTSQHWYLR